MGFRSKKKVENLLSLERMRDLWIGKIDGQVDVIIRTQHPTEEFEVKAAHGLYAPLTQEELGWLRAQVRRSLCGRIGYSLDTGDIVQRTRDTGQSVIEFSLVVTPEPEHPTTVFN
jgi:hypothetical protein